MSRKKVQFSKWDANRGRQQRDNNAGDKNRTASAFQEKKSWINSKSPDSQNSSKFAHGRSPVRFPAVTKLSLWLDNGIPRRFMNHEEKKYMTNKCHTDLRVVCKSEKIVIFSKHKEKTISLIYYLHSTQV